MRETLNANIVDDGFLKKFYRIIVFMLDTAGTKQISKEKTKVHFAIKCH